MASAALTTQQIEQHNAHYEKIYTPTVPVGSQHDAGTFYEPKNMTDKNTAAVDDDDESDYGLEWLFDPTRIDHLPLDEQVALFKKRDLRQVKVFKVACKYWDGPRSRKRVIFAPEMPNADVFYKARKKPVVPPISTVDTKEKPTEQVGEKETAEQDTMQDYQNWLEERKVFRSDLENMGLNEGWLNGKPNKSKLEKQVLARMIDARTPRPVITPPIEEVPADPYLREENPLLKRPSPVAIKLIESFLQKNKMRLIDLFASVDKNKDWKVSREEFKRAVQNAGIPISDVMLEDLVLALDKDLTDQLDYRELAKGMGLWRVEKRKKKRQRVSSGEVSQISHIDSLDSASKASAHKTTSRRSADESQVQASMPQSRATTSHRTIRAVSALSNYSSTSSQYLELPPADHRTEHLMLSSEEAMVDLRKRDKAALQKLMKERRKSKQGSSQADSRSVYTTGDQQEIPIIIKTGDDAVDSHCMASTMVGETGDMIDQYRRETLREYHNVIKMCRQNGIVLTVGLLEKVLLCPADKPHNAISSHIRRPAEPLLSKASVRNTASRSIKHTPSPLAGGYVGGTRSGKGEDDAGGGDSRRGSRTPGRADSKSERRTRSSPKSPDKMTASQVMSSVRVAKSRDKSFGKNKSGASQKPTTHARKDDGKSKYEEGATGSKHRSHGNKPAQNSNDRYLSFSEYESATRQLAHRDPFHYHNTHRSDPNAFWPGQLLDKLRLHMPDDNPKASAVFATVKKEKRVYPGYNNDLNTWPINDAGYVQYANIK